MKRYLLFLSILMITFGSIAVQAQTVCDDLVGFYYLEDPFSGEKSQIQIYKKSPGCYDGKVVWVDNPEKKFSLGLVFLKDLTWDDNKKEWGKGSIKYPGKNGTYSVNARFEDAKTLRVRGYLGMKMLGKTVYWKKEDSQREQK